MGRKLKLPDRKAEAEARKKSSEFKFTSAGGPWTGIRFPEGSQKIAFMAYVHNDGNIRATLRELKKTKAIPGGRVPSARTLTVWSQDNHWYVLKNMVDDGLMDLLESQDDPDVRAAIKDDSTLFKFLLGLRSEVYVQLSTRKSPLMPRNTRDAVTLLTHIQNSMEKVQDRVDGARDRRITSVGGSAVAETPEEVVDAPISIAAYLASKGEPVSNETVAREMIRRREARE